MLAASELERELKTLLHLVHRLMPPLNERPHLFHEQKDALGSAINGLIERCGFSAAPSPRAFCAPQVDAGAREIRVGGKAIPVQRRR